MPNGYCAERHELLLAPGDRQRARYRAVAERIAQRYGDDLCVADYDRAVTDDARRRGADALVMVGGVALVGSAFVHWVSRGEGSGLRGHALIDALIAVGRQFPGLSATRLTILWYLVPAVGAASWVATGLQGAGSRAARIIAILSVVVSAAALLAFARLVGFARLGIGAWLAVAGAAALVTGSWLIAPTRPRPPARATAHRSE
jgi:hypothetical protein